MRTALEAYGEKLTNKKFFQDFVTTTINSNLTGINSFLDGVSEYYKQKTDPNSPESYINKSSYENFEADIKKTTYYNIKSLYDRVGGGSRDKGSVPVHAVSKVKDLNTLEFESLKDIELFYNNVLSKDECFAGANTKSYDLYQIFSVVDRGNNDIGTKVLANLAYIYENYYTDFSAVKVGSETVNNGDKAITNLTIGSLSGLLSGLASQSGFISQQIPNYLNLNSTLSNLTNNDSDLYNVVDSLFGTHTNTSLFGEDILEKRNIKFGGLTGLPGYIYQLGSITSRADTTSPVNKNQVKNNYLNSFCLDVGHDNNSEVKVLSEDAPEEIMDSNITCFTVDFGRQNQQMFNGVQLDTSEFYDTEESIKTWVDLVNKPGVTPQTKNIFPVLEKRSYTCTVTSLGNATIQPLTYFYLRNVPLFHGTYWITNVTHKIVPNNMVTTFKGVRQPIVSKNDVRKELLALMRQQKANILASVNTTNQIVTEGEPDTSGRLQIVQNSNKPYGDIAQDLKSGTGIHYFDGKTIIGAFLFSITGDNEVSVANLGIIASLYNIAKAFKNNTEDHAQIIKTMPVIAVGLMGDQSEFYNDERYADGNKVLSLSKLFKESGNGFVTNGKLANHLNDISTNYSDYGTKMVNPKSVEILDLVGTIKGTETGLVDGNGKITLSTSAKLTSVTSENIPIKETTFFIDHRLTTYEDGMTAERNFDATGSYDTYDVFNSFDPTNKKTINSLNTDVDLIGVTPETKTALGGGNGLTEYPKFQSWCNYIDLTEKASSSEKTIYDAYWEFALTESNGTYDQNSFNTFIQSKLTPNKWTANPTDLKNAWDSLPKTQNAGIEVADKAIFNDIGIPVTFAELKADNPTFSFSIDFEIKFPGGFGDKEYDDLSDPANQLTFWTDYRLMCNVIKEREKSLIKDKTKAATTEKIKIKFLGNYESKVSFFTTKHSNSNYGQINWNPLVHSKRYNLESTTEADSVATKTGIDTKKQNDYLSRIGGIIDEEYKLWGSGSGTLKDTMCDNSTVIAALTKYWAAAKSSIKSFPCEGGDNSPWSAAFISFIMQKSGVEFPFSTSHNVYITKSRDDKNYPWKAYDIADQNATVSVGDLVCYGRAADIDISFNDIKSGSKTHCDCVKDITALKAYSYGGNVSNTVKQTEITLTEAGLLDPSSNASYKKYKCVIKYQPKGTEAASTGSSSGTKDTSISETKSIENKKTVLTLLKNSGLNQIAVAGIMGNMHKETGGKFNPLATNKADTNGYPSLGLIQWNGAFNGINSKDTEKGFDVIGRTVNEQISTLFKMGTYKKWLKEVATAKDAGDAGYLFAKTVEVCYGCNLGENAYYNEAKYGAADRSKLANDYYNRFNNTNDPLYWGSGGSAIASNVTSKTVVIGDSLSQGINSVYPSISRISSPKVLDTVGWRLSQLTTALTGTNTTFPDVKNLILTIGANDGWNLSSGNAKEIELIALVKLKFPNAKYYITNGNYGWGNIAVKPACDATCWINRINNYINVYKNSGFTVVGNVSLCTVHPGKGDTLFTSFNPVLSKLA